MSEKLAAVLASIDALNSDDPNIEFADGQDWPRERLYSERMSSSLKEFCSNAGDELCIAARAQHIQRWKMLRSDYPEGKAGYYQWRTELGRMHADTTVQLMTDAGYSESQAEKARKLLTKQGIKQDKEVQMLEDVICLVFLKHYFLPFANKHPENKVIDILQKTWKKMSDDGQVAALQLELPEHAEVLIGKALG